MNKAVDLFFKLLELLALGFKVIATGGTREFLMRNGVEAEVVWKVHESRPNIVDRMINGEVALAINTPFGKSAFVDDTYIRRTALQMNIPCITTLSAATACVDGIRSLKEGVSTFLAERISAVALVPTISAWMGSSRPPRSTSTQSRIRRGRPKSAHSSSAARTVRPV